ncbi:hypothetical protein TrLO_g10220 [Triparma laevis f. longispina]|uniref:Uncharacterized protein n=1 Tax=Triparma laevis f. longispina TaxID=1714387 RepID=A0A9W7C996_9STRA|nr:hypothetical protein TrLO_g10220 [Triparma laevis f. longispina]
MSFLSPKKIKNSGIKSPVPPSPKIDKTTISPIRPTPPQFSNRRPSVQASLPSEAILMLSPSATGYSWDSDDSSLEARIGKSQPSSTVLLERPITAPGDDLYADGEPSAIDSPNLAPSKLASPVANLPFSVPKHHNRKSWALQPAGQMSSRSSVGASKGSDIFGDDEELEDLEIFAMGMDRGRGGDDNAGGDVDKENAEPTAGATRAFSWESREHVRTGSSMWRLFSVLGIHKNE